MEKSLKKRKIGKEGKNISGLLLNHPFCDLYGIGQSFLHSKLVSSTMVLVITIFLTLSTSYKKIDNNQANIFFQKFQTVQKLCGLVY